MVGIRPSTQLLVISVGVMLLIFVEFGTSCVSTRLKKKVKRPYDRPKYTKRGKCVELSNVPEMCQDLPYNTTFSPNIFKTEDMHDTNIEFHIFQPLLKINCNENLRPFLCSVFYPKCNERGRMVLPCRSLCEAAKVTCENLMVQYGFVWPEPLQCHLFPETETCGFEWNVIKEEVELNNGNITDETDADIGKINGGTMNGNGYNMTEISMSGINTTDYNQTNISMSGINSTEYNKTEISMSVINSNEYNKTEIYNSGINVTDEMDISMSGVNDSVVLNETVVQVNMTANEAICSCPTDAAIENHNKPTTCVKGDYQCRNAKARAYIDGDTLCCFHEKEISYSASCDGDGNIVTSCTCSYTRPPRQDAC